MRSHNSNSNNNNEIFKCPHCDKVCSNKNGLATHMRSHNISSNTTLDNRSEKEATRIKKEKKQKKEDKIEENRVKVKAIVKVEVESESENNDFYGKVAARDMKKNNAEEEKEKVNSYNNQLLMVR